MVLVFYLFEISQIACAKVSDTHNQKIQTRMYTFGIPYEYLLKYEVSTTKYTRLQTRM